MFLDGKHIRHHEGISMKISLFFTHINWSLRYNLIHIYKVLHHDVVVRLEIDCE